MARILWVLLGLLMAVAPAMQLMATTDVVVYGASPGGVVAAVAAASRGLRVMVLEPSAHVGGMLAAGLLDDSVAGNTRAYGGFALAAYQQVRAAAQPSFPII
jgi:NADPH-dependent 2,4-dienoyl-CoA reductase/sulfur reductase-like enzyme